MTGKSDGIADRLELAIKGESINSFAKRCGLRESLVRKYLTGTMPGTDKTAVMSRAADVNMLWLATGEGPMRPGDYQQLDHISEPHTRYGMAQHVPIERMPLERFKLWLDTWWDQASADERIWMKVEFERRFPEYAEFIKKMTEEPSKEQSCA